MLLPNEAKQQSQQGVEFRQLSSVRQRGHDRRMAYRRLVDLGLQDGIAWAMLGGARKP